MSMNSEFTTKIDFLSFPGTKIIDGRDPLLNLAYVSQTESINGVPFKNLFLAPTTITIPKIDVNDLVNLVETFLSSKNKIKSNKKYDFVYEADYFPIERMEISPKEIDHKIHTAIMYEANNTALKMFPHLLNFDDDADLIEFTNLPTQQISLNNWFKMQISIMYDDKHDNYLLEINRMRGEVCPFYKFYHEFKTFVNNSILWLTRKNYIKLFEGNNNENVEPNKKHITRFLFNEMICREICSFIGDQPNVNL